jgi:hypothetical protein
VITGLISGFGLGAGSGLVTGFGLGAGSGLVTGFGLGAGSGLVTGVFGLSGIFFALLSLPPPAGFLLSLADTASVSRMEVKKDIRMIKNTEGARALEDVPVRFMTPP